MPQQVRIDTTLTPHTDSEPTQVPIERFKLTDIPDTMDKMGWEQSARLMRRWFESPAW